MKNKNKKLVKQSKVITQQPKTIQNRNIIDIKSVNIEHPKTSRNLSKTIRQARMVSQVDGAGKNWSRPLCIKTKTEFFLWNKDYKKFKNSKTFSWL